MGTEIAAERFLDPTRFIVWIFFFSISISLPNASGYEMSSVAHPTTLRLSSGLLVKNSPGSKPGALMACERVHIVGLPRLQNLQKYANSLKVKVNTTETNSRALQQNVEVCFHRNASLGIGMCPEGEWEKLIKGSWVRSMSPYSSRVLDIRMPGSSLESLEVSTEEDFLLHRIIFLVLGVVMMTLAPSLSQSVVFYYSSAMAVGIILVILIVLFQLTDNGQLEGDFQIAAAWICIFSPSAVDLLGALIYLEYVAIGGVLHHILPAVIFFLSMWGGLSATQYSWLENSLS